MMVILVETFEPPDVYKRQLLHGLHALHHFGRHHLRHRKRPYDAQRAPDHLYAVKTAAL